MEDSVRIRLERCKTCNKPYEGTEGKCPGNLGIGCIGDWRCCKEMDVVCKDCDTKDVLMCGNTGCKKMSEYKLTEKN